MSTLKSEILSTTLFNKTRRAILALLYGHPEKAFYIRHILRVVNTGHGAVQRELKRLTEAAILQRSAQGHQVYYQANKESLVFQELKSIITKTAGIGDTLRKALAPLAERIKIACIYGSVARGEEDQYSDIDLLIVGDVTFAEIVKSLQNAQQILGREINPTVYPISEFLLRITEEHYFIQNVLDSPRIFIMGDEDELNRLVESRLVERT